jgi:hypothetical protein
VGTEPEAGSVIIVADAGPLLHLFWVDALEWALPPQEIIVVETVWREAKRYEPAALQGNRLRRVPDTVTVPELLATRQLDSERKLRLPMRWHSLTS